MPWSGQTVEEQKLNFIRDVESGKSTLASLCRYYGISRPTGYKWLARYREQGVAGLPEQSKKPHSHPNRTPAEIENLIVSHRLEFPKWGARKLKALIEREQQICLPAESTVNQILKRHSLIDPIESRKRQALGRFERDTPNELWQIDFKGHFKMQDGHRCYPLTIIDDYSRFNVGIKAGINETCKDTQKLLYEVFSEFGLPDQINVDNGNPWGNIKARGYTTFTVWLMKLGIHVSHSRPSHPQTNGKDERFHRTLKSELISMRKINNIKHAQALFDEWRKLYNYRRPHEAIGLVPPTTRYEKSLKKLPSKVPNINYEEGLTTRKVCKSGRISYEGARYVVGEAFVGEYVELRQKKENGTIDIYFGKNKIAQYNLNGDIA